MGVDLGTYHVKVEFVNKPGFYMEFSTGCRYTHGTTGIHPLSAYKINPIYDNENDLIRNIVYMFTEGNYSCDCNLAAFIAQAHQRDDPNMPCGDTIELKRLTLIRPDGSESVIYGE
jgi:hypothetical protein